VAFKVFNERKIVKKCTAKKKTEAYELSSIKFYTLMQNIYFFRRQSIKTPNAVAFLMIKQTYLRWEVISKPAVEAQEAQGSHQITIYHQPLQYIYNITYNLKKEKKQVNLIY